MKNWEQWIANKVNAFRNHDDKAGILAVVETAFYESRGIFRAIFSGNFKFFSDFGQKLFDGCPKLLLSSHITTTFSNNRYLSQFPLHKLLKMTRILTCHSRHSLKWPKIWTSQGIPMNWQNAVVNKEDDKADDWIWYFPFRKILRRKMIFFGFWFGGISFELST